MKVYVDEQLIKNYNFISNKYLEKMSTLGSDEHFLRCNS
jgi:hypothetical protein